MSAVRAFEAETRVCMQLATAGQPSLGLALLYVTLAETTDPRVRQSPSYWEAECLAAAMTVSYGRRLLGLPDVVRAMMLSMDDLTRHLSLHVHLALMQVQIDALNVERATELAQDVWDAVADLDEAHSGGYVAVRNLLADRLFALGDSASAEREWQTVRQSLARAGRLDGAADRLLASNIAIARWRAGDEPGAIEVLKDSLDSRPPTEADRPASLYPIVGLVELLRTSGRSKEAAEAFAGLNRHLRPIEPVDIAKLGSETTRMLAHTQEQLVDLNHQAAQLRTYYPSCGTTGVSRSPESPLRGVAFYGEAPGVLTIAWCTPEELLTLHGPDDELFLTSVRVLSMAARSWDILAVYHLQRTRKLLEMEHPGSPLVADLDLTEKAGLALFTGEA